MNEEEAHNNTRPKKIRSKRSKYSKISLKSKIVFFQKVIHEQADLREVLLFLLRLRKNWALSTPPLRLWSETTRECQKKQI
jgi:hypothetical protein